MPRKVRGPDGVVRIFPDDATDAEIAAALDAIDRQPSLMAPKPTWGDMAVNALPSIGGTLGGLAGGTLGAGTVVGAVPGAITGATAGGGVGEAIRQLVDRFMGVDQPTPLLQRAKDVAVEGAVQGGAEALGAGASKFIIQPAAKAVMRGYLKPSLAATEIRKAREIVDTALSEALPVTAGGERRAERLIADINKQVGGMLQGVKGKVDLQAVANKVRSFAQAKYFKPGVSDADYQAALEVADLIDQHASLKLPSGARITQVNAKGANEIKTAVRPNSRAYGQQGASAEAEARKAAGSDMRQAIEDVAAKEGKTEIGPLNERERKLIDAQGAILRAAGREENKGLNPTAVPNLLGGLVGSEEYARTRDPASSIAWAMATRAALSPAIATRIAIKASQLSKNGYAPAAAARMAMEFFSESEQKPQRNPQRP